MVTAKVVFDGVPEAGRDYDIFNDETISNVMVQFEGEFEYDDSGTTGNHTVTILEKTYTLKKRVTSFKLEFKSAQVCVITFTA